MRRAWKTRNKRTKKNRETDPAGRPAGSVFMLWEKGEGERGGNDAMGRLERIRRRWMRTMGFAAADQWSALRESGRSSLRHGRRERDLDDAGAQPRWKIPRLRCAPLGMTEERGCGFARGLAGRQGDHAGPPRASAPTAGDVYGCGFAGGGCGRWGSLPPTNGRR